MKDALVLILILFLNLLIALYLAIYFRVSNKIDLIIAKSIERYPNGEEYKLSSTTGFPDGHPGSDISFYTKDSPETVKVYFDKEFVNDGWTLRSKSKEKQVDISGSYMALYGKKIGKYNFNALFTNTLSDYDNPLNLDNDRVLIFITRSN